MKSIIINYHIQQELHFQLADSIGFNFDGLIQNGICYRLVFIRYLKQI